MEALPNRELAAVGYGLAYPFGVIGIVLLVQLVPRLLHLDLNTLEKELQSGERERRQIEHVLVEVQNPAVVGKRLDELETITDSNCQVTRVLRRNRLVPVPRGLVLESGQYLLVIGRAFRLERIVPFLGSRIDRSDYVLDTENQKSVVGKSLRELRLVGTFGVTVSRFMRHELDFVPDLDDVVQWGDALVVVGEPDNLNRFAAFAGHRASVFDQTDLISLSLGIIVGVVLGSVSFELAGERFALGVVGGPMLVALLVGHYGHIGRIYASLPRASRLLLMELGLVLFLADAGVKAGGPLMDVLGRFGPQLAVVALAATLVPLVAGTVVARRLLRMNFLQILGGICGGATSTPGLGLITARSDSEIPVTSYAAAYPIALILMTVFARLLVALLP
jgi:putative transport protein